MKERARAVKRKKIASIVANTKPGSATERIKKERKARREEPTTSCELKKDNSRKRKRKRYLMAQRSNKKRKISQLSSSCDIDPVATPTEEYLEREMKEWVELGVPCPLMRALHDLKFHQPTEIQRRAIPLVAKGDNDLIGAAETVSINFPFMSCAIETTINLPINMKLIHAYCSRVCMATVAVYYYESYVFLSIGIWKDTSVWYSHSPVHPQQL